MSAWSRAARPRVRALVADVRRVAGSGRHLITTGNENDLPTYASAICFQVLFALAPVLLAGLAILGFLDLTEVYDSELAPRIQAALPAAVYSFVNSSAHEVLRARSGFWLSLGAALALWYISGATRALMGAMEKIHAAEHRRRYWSRMGISLLLTLAVAFCFFLASLAIYFVPPLLSGLDVGTGLRVVSEAARWLLALVLLQAVVWLFLRFGTARRLNAAWGSLSAVLIVVGWLAASFLFHLYVTRVASYDSLFGNLASIIIALAYLYTSSLVLLYGLQIDALVRGVTGESEKGRSS